MPTLTKRRGKKRWRAQVMIKREVKTKWFPDATRESKRLALEWEVETRKKLDLEQKLLSSTVTGCSVLAWGNAYLDYSAKHHADKTYVEKRSCFEMFTAFFGADTAVENLVMQLGEPVLSRLQEYFDRQWEKRSGYAANKDRKNLRVAWSWGSKYLAGFPRLRFNPFSELDKYPEVRKPRYVPPLGDFWAVFDRIEGNGSEAVQDRVMLLFCLHLAVRRGEVFRALKTDVTFTPEPRIRIGTRKRENGDMEYDLLPLTPELAKALRNWIDEHPFPDSEHLFLSLADNEHYGQPFTSRQHAMKRWCERAGVEPFGFHAIRHLTASHLQEGGFPESYIKEILRHKSEATTRRYLRGISTHKLKGALKGMPRRTDGQAINANQPPEVKAPEADLYPVFVSTGYVKGLQ